MPSIKEIIEKIKSGGGEWLVIGSILLASTLGFGLGRLSKIEAQKPPVRIEQKTASVVLSQVDAPKAGNYVASKNGTKYHLPSCPGAKQISEKNKIFFATKDEAERAGFTPAANCKGL